MKAAAASLTFCLSGLFLFSGSFLLLKSQNDQRPVTVQTREHSRCIVSFIGATINGHNEAMKRFSVHLDSSVFSLGHATTLQKIHNRRRCGGRGGVSSVLNRDVKQYGKKYLFDCNEETCWNSDQVKHLIFTSRKHKYWLEAALWPNLSF
ncbi:unnamed protein product [Tetraodon nigroviridis]|uniref:(spotted green pufferfish) hypothetical protein n=1 Tax=Tetraodon nigroviridis TaxID=99883 RepID=Q4S3C3_TETNG|nr:unnamed protein product [Tetraodon nigroviridis]